MRTLLAISVLALTACSAEADVEAQVSSQTKAKVIEVAETEAVAPKIVVAKTVPAKQDVPPKKLRGVQLAEADPIQTGISCHGIAKQGGLVVCQTTPNAHEPAAFVRVGNARVDFEIKPRSYDTSRIDGLPKKFVSEYTAEQLKQIRKASALKKVGFASKVACRDPHQDNEFWRAAYFKR